MAVIGDENAGHAPANPEWMEQRMPERRRFTQTTSVEERLAKEAMKLRKQAQSSAPTASHMTEWLASAYKHQDKFN